MHINYIILLVCVLAIVLYYLNYSNTLYSVPPSNKKIIDYLLANHEMLKKEKTFNSILNNITTDINVHVAIDTALLAKDVKALRKLIRL